MSELNIRAASEDDLDAIMQIEESSFGSTAWPVESMQSELSPGFDRHYFVAEFGEEMVGYAGCSAIPNAHADVMTIAVAQQHRGKKIGGALMQKLLEVAKANHCTEMFLEVRADNEVAQNLYRKLGFVQIDLRRGYYQPEGIDAVIMKLKLNEPRFAGVS